MHFGNQNLNVTSGKNESFVWNGRWSVAYKKLGTMSNFCVQRKSPNTDIQSWWCNPSFSYSTHLHSYVSLDYLYSAFFLTKEVGTAPRTFEICCQISNGKPYMLGSHKNVVLGLKNVCTFQEIMEELRVFIQMNSF
jgi:hypothetical protein